MQNHKTRREYFAKRIRSLATTHENALFPTTYNVVVGLFATYANLLMSDDLVSVLQPSRTYLNRRMVGIPLSASLIRMNAPFRRTLIRMTLEIRESMGERDAELAELALLMHATKQVIGIPEERTIDFDGTRLSFPRFFAHAMTDAHQNYIERLGITRACA